MYEDAYEGNGQANPGPFSTREVYQVLVRWKSQDPVKDNSWLAGNVGPLGAAVVRSIESETDYRLISYSITRTCRGKLSGAPFQPSDQDGWRVFDGTDPQVLKQCLADLGRRTVRDTVKHVLGRVGPGGAGSVPDRERSSIMDFLGSRDHDWAARLHEVMSSPSAGAASGRANAVLAKLPHANVRIDNLINIRGEVGRAKLIPTIKCISTPTTPIPGDLVELSAELAGLDLMPKTDFFNRAYFNPGKLPPITLVVVDPGIGGFVGIADSQVPGGYLAGQDPPSSKYKLWNSEELAQLPEMTQADRLTRRSQLKLSGRDVLSPLITIETGQQAVFVGTQSGSTDIFVHVWTPPTGWDYAGQRIRGVIYPLTIS